MSADLPWHNDPARGSTGSGHMQASHLETDDVLRQVLHVVDRTILPRIIELRTADMRLQIEASAQRLLLCPKRDGKFYLDDKLKHEAPDVWNSLRSSNANVTNLSKLLNAHRDALLRQCARALQRLSSGAAWVEWAVKALRPSRGVDKVSAVPSFGVQELAAAMAYGEAGQMTPPASPAAVSSQTLPPLEIATATRFYRQIAPRMADAWLFSASGEPVGVPSRAGNQAAVPQMAEAAVHARTWQADVEELVKGPVMAVFVGQPREELRCLAIDGGHVALASCTGVELGVVLAGWLGAATPREAVNRGNAGGESGR